MDLLVQAFGYFNVHNSALTDKVTKANASSKDDILAKRRRLIGSKCQTFFEEDPLIVSKASMQYIYDDAGNKFTDCISNVQHVGHCHPAVVEAISNQLANSTCNVRFVSSKLNECAEELLKTLPGLDTVLFCNSGSEANDLAVRLARDFTQNHDVVVLDHAYHGHLTTTLAMSPYKFDHGCSVKKPDWVRVAPPPDVYRGVHRLTDQDLHSEEMLEQMGMLYASEVNNVFNEIQADGRSTCAFIAEALQSCGGQVLPPKGYWSEVGRHAKEHGALVIVDEVQTGFGRVGSTFWAHQLDGTGFVPDIITMGKPMGNGFPVSAVVTRKEIADKLGGNVGYFNTYGGNPVACAAVLGVLSVIRSENLLNHSERMSKLFHEELEKLHEKHECIGDVRGVGMFWGVDLVVSRETREPATRLANDVVMKLRQEYGVLLSADGPHSNVLKFKPPLCFNASDLKKAVSALDSALLELTQRR
ncbi:Protein T01B11.2 a [Aphelenchoides avenae]|nr:Protein T01B11.2 a [Aphelenchus avenae]